MGMEMINSFDTLESGLEQTHSLDNLFKLNKAFSSDMTPVDGVYQAFDPEIDENIARYLCLDDAATVSQIYPTLTDATHRMLFGIEENGVSTLGLQEISEWKINPDYQYQNLKQQSGYAAEVVSTYKENLTAKANGSEITTYRADDLPELFSKNDQYVDKVRMDSNGNIVETIQTKFVGANGEEWVNKMMSKKFDKYFSDGKVDKIECPKDYYDDAMKSIAEKRKNLQEQLTRVTADGKTEVAENIQKQLNKLDQLETMTEKSMVTTDEAMFARLHPKAYAAKVFVKEVASVSNREGLKSGAMAAGLTCVVSTVEDMQKVLDGEMTGKEMALDVLEDTVAAGALGYGTAFISTAVSQSLKASSNQLLRTVGGSCLPAAAVSFVVESADDVIEYAKGELSGTELAFNLGENAANIAGAIACAKVGGVVGAEVGAAIGSVAGPAGTAVGAAVGGAVGSIAGGVIGCVVATEMYETAIEIGSEAVEFIADKAVEYANVAIDAVSDFGSEAVDTVKNAFGSFLGSVGIKI